MSKKSKIQFNFGGVTIVKELTPEELEKEKKELRDNNHMFSYSVINESVKLDSVEKSENKNNQNNG